MRRLISSSLAGLAVLAATVAWSSWAATSTVLDPGRTGRVAEVLATDPAVRGAIEDALAQALISVIPPDTAVPDAELKAAARRALDDPRVAQVVQAAIVDAHRRLVGEIEGPVRVDAGPIAAAGRDALLAAHPQLAGRLPAPPPLAIDLPTDSFPDLGGVRDLLAGGVTGTAVQAALGLFAAALLVASDRPRVLRRAGYFALWSGGGWVVLGVLAPWAVSHWSVDGKLAVLGSLAVAVAGPMIAPAVALLVGALGAFLLASAWTKAAAARKAGVAVPAPAPAPYRSPWERVTPEDTPGPAVGVNRQDDPGQGGFAPPG
ncbi:MAG: hypothetical protein ACRD0O_04745, partial [Acidimicrobiia bacterium]